MQTSDLLKSLDAHYARILQMHSFSAGDQDFIVSSSFDKSIKVWNIRNVFERVHTIDRMESSIDSISFSESKNLIAYSNTKFNRYLGFGFGTTFDHFIRF